MSKLYQQETDEERSVTRLQNRALRSTTRKLRKHVRSLQQKADEAFELICTTPTEAELAFEELWERGGFLPGDGGPQNYRYIVDTCLAALTAVRDRDAATTSTPGCVTP